MYYPEETVEEVRSRSDIVAVIGQYVHLTKKSGRYFGCCPFHNEKTPSFSVSQDKQMYYCFGCGAGGNVFTFLMQYENYTFSEAMETLAERAGIELPKQEASEAEKRQADLKSRILQASKDAATFYYKQLRLPQGARALAYFRKRGLSDETMRKFGLGYAPQSGNPLYQYLKGKGYSDEVLKESRLLNINEKGVYDRFWNRAMFPIMDSRNRVIAFGGRVMGDGEPKYLNSPESMVFDKSRNLYGLNLARSSRRPYLLLCEGYMDVISLHQAGFDCAVASLGTAFTPGHATLIRRLVDEVIITYDSDGAGQKAALRAIPILKQGGLSVKVLNMKPYKDPDEFLKNLGAEEYQKRIDTAVNSFLYETDVMAAGTDMADPEKKTAFHRAVASKLTEFTDELERENYLTAVAARHGIKESALREMVSYIGGRTVTAEPEPAAPSAARTQTGNGRDKALGIHEAERMILNFLTSDDEKRRAVRKLIRPEYISDPLYRQVAERIYAEPEDRIPEPSAILDAFAEDETDRGRVAELFHTEPPEDRDTALRVLTENIKLVKGRYLDQVLRASTDPAEVQKAAVEKANLQRIRI